MIHCTAKILKNYALKNPREFLIYSSISARMTRDSAISNKVRKTNEFSADSARR